MLSPLSEANKTSSVGQGDKEPASISHPELNRAISVDEEDKEPASVSPLPELNKTITVSKDDKETGPPFPPSEGNVTICISEEISLRSSPVLFIMFVDRAEIKISTSKLEIRDRKMWIAQCWLYRNDSPKRRSLGILGS